MDNYGYNASYYYAKIRQLLQPYINYYVGYSPNIDMIMTDNIYISDFATSCDKNKLQELGITHIVCCIIGVIPQFPDDFQYLNIDIGDIYNQNISEYFNICNNFIEEAHKNNGKVLIHCMYGRSRSVTLTCAYLMKKYLLTATKALNIIKNARPIAQPNPGFIYQLEQFEGCSYLK